MKTLENKKLRRDRGGRFGNQSGMTLIEIIIVLALIGLIMAGLVKGYGALFGQGQAKVAKSAISSWETVLELYYANNGSYPESIDDLCTTKKKNRCTADDDQNYGVKPSMLLDPWKKEWIYEVEDGVPVIISGGPDKQEGGGDDIRSDEE
jgi:general secretion pathway protein G